MQPIHVERKRFDRYLTRLAEQAGAEIWLKTTAVSIAREEQWMVAQLRRLGPAETIMRAALPRWLLYPSVVMAASAVGWSLSADRLLGLPHDAAVQALVFALAFLIL